MIPRGTPTVTHSPASSPDLAMTARRSTKSLVDSAVGTADGEVGRQLLRLRLLLYPALVGLLLVAYWIFRGSSFANPVAVRELLWVGLAGLPVAYLLELGFHLTVRHRRRRRLLHLLSASLFVLGTTYAVQLCGSLTHYTVMWYLIVIVFVRLRLDQRAAILVTSLAASSYIVCVVLEQLGIVPYARLLQSLYQWELIQGSGHAVLTATGVVAFLILSHYGAHFLARGLERREKAVAGVTQTLAVRTNELSAALTQLKETQSQLVESKMQITLNRFVAGLLHEFNSPLGTLSSSLDTVGRTLDRARPFVEKAAGDEDRSARQVLRAIETQAELSGILKTSCERLTSILASLRRTVGLDEAEINVVDLRQGIEDARTLLRPALGDRIRMTCDLPDTPIVVRCYPAKLTRIFVNLLQNAVAAIEDRGEIKILMAQHKDTIDITFVDDGRGISEEKLPHLFDIGFSTNKEGRVGLQLGLPTTKRWVEEIGGKLSISSKAGEGTTVRIVLPLAKG
jgi:signal transduction histidine kinase